MRFSVLSSGSKANCTFVEAGETRILIDCGLSAREAEKRLASLGIDPGSIDAVIVTHEHTDHINGIPVFSKRHKIPVFANGATAQFIPGVAVQFFETGEDFSIGKMLIHPFSIVHDASDPVGFTVNAEGLKFSLAMDLGRVTPLVMHAVSNSHALVLESNHDRDMLMQCDYPWVLKQRINSTHGHLSNETAAGLLSDVMHSELLHVILGHLSENSNTPELALAASQRFLSERLPLTLAVSSIYSATPLLAVGESSRNVAA